jgi:predicted nucleic acid-binding protein
MSHYADSSFLASCYLIDAHTPRAKAYLLGAGLPLVFTALQSLEVRNAFRLGVFRGLFSASDAASARANLALDLQRGRLIKKTVKWPLAFRIASHLSERHSALIGTRSLDVLHVAAAKSLRAKAFVSFDERQRKLAAAVGLTVVP